MFVDSHCHLEMEEYDRDRASVIGRAVKDGISYMLTVGTEEKYFSRVLEIVETYEIVYGAIGVHPHNATQYSDALETRIRGHLKHAKIVGYGEIGLDFFRNHSPRDAQIAAFRRQITLAREAGLPIVIHSRNAEEETLAILKESRLDGHKTIIHCYSYGIDTARKFLDMGFYLSIPGTITYKNARLADVIKFAPLDRILSETDAPFLTPEPKRGKRNEPVFVKWVVEEIARIKGIPVEETASLIATTFRRVFLEQIKA